LNDVTEQRRTSACLQDAGHVCGGVAIERADGRFFSLQLIAFCRAVPALCG